MRAITCASLGLAALTFFLIPASASPSLRLDADPSWRQAGSLPELAEILENWLDGHAGPERRDWPPSIKIVEPSVAASMNGTAGRGHGRTRGLYDHETSTILLIRPWDPKVAEDVSVLLHELVHHRQAPNHFYCPGAQEEQAYRLQDVWLRERGLQADVNWIAVVLEAGCTPRDMHPD